MKYFSTLLCGAVAAAGFSFAVVAQDHGQHDRPAATTPPAGTARPAPAAVYVGDPYLFDTCPITGKKLSAMGDPVVKVYDGRDVRLCCPACPPKFEADKTADFAKLDKRIIKDQSPLYPLKTSVVTGKDLPEKPYELLCSNRLIRLGAESDKADVTKDPKKYLGTLDKAVVAAQGEHYPLMKCPVSKEEFGGDVGNPVDVVVAGRLIRLCCNDCKKDLQKDPAKFIGMVDAARHDAADKSGHQEGDEHAEHEHGEHHDHQ